MSHTLSGYTYSSVRSLDEYREGIIVGSACADGEVFDTLRLMVLTRQLVANIDFIEVMPPVIYVTIDCEGLH